ncbi:MAG: helix-turn-helix transcriptional regulator [Ruminococcaceae bacterium]|nr:helix-turn-helix transcriptional regulator [Oscillospiraceae bacterium]
MSYTTLGDKIKYHRKRMGLTQEQLAQRLGVSAQAVSKWENNLSCPDISVLPEMAALFGISVDELLNKTSSEQPAHQAEVVDDDNDYNVIWTWDIGKKLKSVLFALYIIAFGSLMLVNHIYELDVSWWTVCWTLFVTFIGLSGLCAGFSVFSLTLTLGGAYFLLDSYGVFSFDLSWGIVIPAVFLLWGLSLLIDVIVGKKWRGFKPGKVNVKSNKKLRNDYSCDNGYLVCDLAFGSCRSVVSTDLLRGGKIDASFGEFSVDFSACKAVAPNCTVEVDMSFGSLTLLVPRRFQIRMDDDSNAFASAHIEGAPNEIPDGILHLALDNSFGTCKIRYTES